jgi:uncharacterized HAD superfamily protein
MDTEKTAVEWLETELCKSISFKDIETVQLVETLIKKALQIEQEQFNKYKNESNSKLKAINAYL